MQSIYLAGGCFWCIESVYLSVKGVLTIKPGYMGGTTDNPTYAEICKGSTGHAEVIKCDYSEKQISLEKILDIFFLIHDPTQLNRQGHDIGTQYRSAIFLNKLTQMKTAEFCLAKAKSSYKEKIYTELSIKSVFYPAEEYHQDYYKKNPNSGYCNILIPPKLEKLKELFAENFKEYI